VRDCGALLPISLIPEALFRRVFSNFLKHNARLWCASSDFPDVFFLEIPYSLNAGQSGGILNKRAGSCLSRIRLIYFAVYLPPIAKKIAASGVWGSDFLAFSVLRAYSGKPHRG
jgi:hypothetical protein